MTATTVTAAQTARHIYQLEPPGGAMGEATSGEVATRREYPGGTGWVGPVIRGGRAQVALVRRARGTGSPVHTHPNEQFSFVLSGTLYADLDGAVLTVPAGHVVHVPAGMPHSFIASAEEDALYYSMKDVRASFEGTPVAGASAGARRLEAGRAPAPLTVNASGKRVQYVYDITRLDAVPDGATSAAVLPRKYLSGKSSSFGAALRGDLLQVGHVHKAVGSGTKLHTHPNEQFSFVLQGTMLYEIDGRAMEAPPQSVTHLPPGIRHSAIASAAGDVITFVVKDTSHGMSGPPVDGIEDGPLFLPGFGPKKS